MPSWPESCVAFEPGPPGSAQAEDSDPGLRGHQEDRRDDQQARDAADDALAAGAPHVLVRERHLAVAGGRDLALGHRLKPAILRDEIATEDPAEHDHDRK